MNKHSLLKHFHIPPRADLRINNTADAAPPEPASCQTDCDLPGTLAELIEPPKEERKPKKSA